ncbi:MAG: 2-dehydropantoate 2-reductase [Desulfobacteraceae bacterium]|jgi:2-dehydropantoate 2-reductase
MKVAIVGAGAMGSLFGVLLKEAGHDVWLLYRKKEKMAIAHEHGITVEYKGQRRNIMLKTAFHYEQIGLSDLTIIFVKSHQTEAVAKTAVAIAGSKGVVLTLQNGLGNVEKLTKHMDQNRIIAGTTTHGATMLGIGHIRHSGSGITIIGNWKNDNMEVVKSIANEFTEAKIPCQTVEHIRPVIWEKLLVNVGINAITALTGIRNGQLLDMAVTRELSQLAVEEAVAVAQAKGITVRKDIIDHVFKVATSTASNRSSMGQDVDYHRFTEIDAINGMVVEIGKQLSIPTPANQTLAALVETLQEHYN